MEPAEQEKRLLIVSNRLPLTCKKDPKTDSWSFARSSGGLVAALSGLSYSRFIWIGWPGIHIDNEEERREIEKELLEKHSCMPVWLPADIMDKYYNGFCNDVLWPLFHYKSMHYSEDLYSAYETANHKFADSVAKVCRADDLIWVHDYHLMLMPKMLREQFPSAQIGFFLHVPFPSSELYKELPKRKELLLGVLNSDLVGFHTFDYARHFQQACIFVLGCETSASTVLLDNRVIPVGVFPVGIEPDKFLNNLKTDKVKERIAELREKYKGKKVLIGVDRLDYIKGIPLKLRGFELFLQKYPEWQGKVVLIQVAVPSRENVEEYRQLKREVDMLVGKINSEYGTVGFHPIQYLYHSVTFDELTALYAISDACVITSIRDGMNLVAQEYIACQIDGHGALILSEFAGAAQSLSASIRINPWKIKDIAGAIYKAITTPEELGVLKRELLFRHVTTHTAASWGENFINALKKATKETKARNESLACKKEGIEKVLQSYKNHLTRPRLIVLAYDGTLLPFDPIPALCAPSPHLLKLLQQLMDAGNTVIIVSGRDKQTMANWFHSLPGLGLGAEHGYFYRPPNCPKWRRLITNLSTKWKDAIRPVLKHYTDRTPGSSFEEKQVTFTWHYRMRVSNLGLTETQHGASQASDLMLHLNSNFGRWPIEVLNINKTVEIRPNDVNATRMIKTLLQQHLLNNLKMPNFVLYVGDSLVVPTEISTLRETYGRRSRLTSALTSPRGSPPLTTALDIIAASASTASSPAASAISAAAASPGSQYYSQSMLSHAKSNSSDPSLLDAIQHGDGVDGERKGSQPSRPPLQQQQPTPQFHPSLQHRSKSMNDAQARGLLGGGEKHYNQDENGHGEEEEMHVVTCLVGKKTAPATLYFSDSEEVLPFLSRLAEEGLPTLSASNK